MTFINHSSPVYKSTMDRVHFIFEEHTISKLTWDQVNLILDKQCRPKLTLDHVYFIIDQSKVNFYKYRSDLNFDCRPVHQFNCV